MSGYECEACGIAAMDLPDGFDVEFYFERGEDGRMLCQGCHAIAEADRRWTAGDW